MVIKGITRYVRNRSLLPRKSVTILESCVKNFQSVLLVETLVKKNSDWVRRGAESYTVSHKKLEQGIYFEKYTLDGKGKKYILNVLKELSVDAIIDDVLALLGCQMGGNFKISNEEVCRVLYHWKSVFKTKILVKVVLSLDIH